VLTTAMAGRAGQRISDEEQLAYATAAGRVLVTSDRDFVQLAAIAAPHGGVLLMQRLLSIGAAIEYLELAAPALSADEVRDQLVYCDW
jgi:hypothetical protein